jgi:hypothetical protein
MTINTADGWFAAARDNSPKIIKSAAFTTVAGQPFSTWDVAGNPGAGSLAIGNTTTGVVPTDATAGAPNINAFGGGALGYLARAWYRASVAGGATLYDRLWHAGSVAMNALATTPLSSQPAITQRLPGASDYTGLEILLEINAAVSATATTVTVTYTNQAGVTGRTTGATASLSGLTNRRVVAMPLQAGDTGVQKIESVTVGGTVATTGSFNVVLARRIDEFDIRIANALDAHGWDVTAGPPMFTDQCLWLVVQPDSTSSGTQTLGVTIING